MVSLRCGDYMTTVDLSNVDAERVEGKDYSAGYRTYGFAAPLLGWISRLLLVRLRLWLGSDGCIKCLISQHMRNFVQRQFDHLQGHPLNVQLGL